MWFGEKFIRSEWSHSIIASQSSVTNTSIKKSEDTPPIKSLYISSNTFFYYVVFERQGSWNDIDY